MPNTSGYKLKTIIGLQYFKEVYITRVITQSTKPIYFIFYDSLRKNMPMPKKKARDLPYTAMIYAGSDLAKNRYDTPVMTPLMRLISWNGNPNNGLFTLVDLSYTHHLNARNFDRLPENTQKKIRKNFTCTYIPKEIFNEFVTIKDLMDKENISDFTMGWRKDRTRIMGGENTTAKFIDCFLNGPDNSVTFVFKTPATKYDEPKKRVLPLNLKLTSNSEKQYEIQIKFLEFFDWLSTHPEGQPLTPKDIKEMMEVSNVQIFSSSPSFQFQGINYWNTQIDSAIYPENRKPKRWNKIHGEGQAFLDKHLYGLIRQMGFFMNPMASMLNKKLRDRGLL